MPARGRRGGENPWTGFRPPARITGAKPKPVDDDGAAPPPPLAGQAANVGDEIQELGHGHFAVAGSALGEVAHAGFGGHRRGLDVVPADRDLAGEVVQ